MVARHTVCRSVSATEPVCSGSSRCVAAVTGAVAPSSSGTCVAFATAARASVAAVKASNAAMRAADWSAPPASTASNGSKGLDAR